MQSASDKVCVLCGQSCAGKPRVKDQAGRYYCKACHDQALARQHSPAAPPPTEQPAPDANVFALEDILSDEAAAPLPEAPPITSSGRLGRRCSGCQAELPTGSVICVNCGTRVGSGRSVRTTSGISKDDVDEKVRPALKLLSFLTGFGILPVGSDALGHHRPRATWLIVAVTCLVSIWFWTLSGSEMMQRKDLMLWTGSAQQDADHLRMMYEYTDYGNWSEFTHQIQVKHPDGRYTRSLDAIPDHVIIDAHLALDPHERATARYKGFQLLTHGLLHADIFHLFGNMLFLVIFGARINALIGNLATLVLYPILIVIAGVMHMVASSSGPPIPMLGASGAVMGMAGMYFVLFPLSKVFMAAYIRLFIVIFRMTVWAVYGLVVVGAYILIDVFWISLALDTGTAHWAHIGGFLGGVVLAAILLLSRLLNAGGADLISVTLGKHAWSILGKPGEHGLPGLQLPRFATEDVPADQRYR